MRRALAAALALASLAFGLASAEDPKDAVGPIKVPADHPRLVVTRATLGKIKERAKEEPWKAHLEGVRARAKAFLAGCDLADPGEKSYSLQPRCHQLCQDVATLALHALLSDDPEAAKAADAFFEKVDTSKIEAQLAPNDLMSRGEFLYGWSIAYDWSFSVVGEKARSHLGDIVRRNARTIYEGMVGKKSWEATCEANNHSMAAIGGVGLAAIALTGEEKDARAWLDLSAAKVRSYLASSFDEDGAGFEGNLYGPFGAEMALPFAASLRALGGRDPFADGRLPAIVRWLVTDALPGNGSLNSLNDSGDCGFPRNLTLYAAFAYKDAVARWAFEEAGRTGRTNHPAWPAWLLLWDDPTVTATPPGRDLHVRRHRGRGLVNVRTGFDESDVFASFECGARPNGTHCQSDHGQVTLYGMGGRFLVDPGYSNVDKEGSGNQSIAHNLVLVDGKGEAISGSGKVVEAKTTAYFADDVLVAVTGDLSPAYGEKGYNPVARAMRTFLWVRSSKKPYVVLVDEIAKPDQEKHRFESLLHTGPSNKVAFPGKGEATIAAEKATLHVRWLCGLPLKTETRSMSFEHSFLGAHPVVVASAEAPAWACATLLSFDEEGASYDGESKGDRLTIRAKRGDETDTITVQLRSSGERSPIQFVRKTGSKQTYTKKL